MQLFKGYFNAAVVLSFALMGTGTIAPKASAADKPVCQENGARLCNCARATGKKDT